MAETTKIAWCDATVNLWWGCFEVGPECDDCYARMFAKRVGKGRAWEDVRYEVPSAAATLDKLDRKAAKRGEPITVFVQSMGDIFERSQQLVTWDGRFTGKSTGRLREAFIYELDAGRWPNLVFLFLTKRPGLIREMVPSKWLDFVDSWPANVWTGTSVGCEKSVPQIGKLAAQCGPHFVSFEPLLKPVRFRWQDWHHKATSETYREYLERTGSVDQYESLRGIGWAIVGCESKGPRVGRLPEGGESAWIDAAVNLVEELRDAGIPTFVKQVPIAGLVSHDPSEWPALLQFREFPQWFPVPA